jgi:uncharacterized protein YggT (Ycf19 family)
MEALFDALAVFLQIYVLCVLAWALISWLPFLSPQLAYNQTILSIRRFLDSIVLPWIRLFRFVPPVGIGGQMIDLSALVAILVLQVGGGVVLGLLRGVLVG